MSDPVRKKLDELKELRQENYITEEEYAAARGNALLDAGFDTAPRSGAEARSRRAPLQGGKKRWTQEYNTQYGRRNMKL